MLVFRDFSTALRKLGINRSDPVIAHASLSAFGEVHGGAETLLGALLMSYSTLIMPVFTYKTMITPEVGPPDNGMRYGTAREANLMAEIYRPTMPADRLMGCLPEALRNHPKALRSSHPILSFTGVNARQILDSQSLLEPLMPITKLVDANGWVILLGVNHTVNTSIHYAEKLAGRKQFIRWALTHRGIVECPQWPGCSFGFQALAPRLEGATRLEQIGESYIQAVPLPSLVAAVKDLLAEDPLALLCDRGDCERCNAVRQSLRQ